MSGVTQPFPRPCFITPWLKEKATRCEFHDEDREIKTHIIHKTTDSRLRRKALRETMTLNELLTYGNTLEKIRYRIYEDRTYTRKQFTVKSSVFSS